MNAEQYTAERSTLDKKPEWGGALVGHHHHAYFHQHQQQNMPQMQRAFVHHHHLVGGCLDGATFQPDAGALCAETAYGNLNPNDDACGMQHACRFNAASSTLSHCDRVGAVVHMPTLSAHNNPSRQLGMPALDASTNKSHKSSVIAAKPRPARIMGAHVCAGKGNLSISTSIKTSAPRRMRNTSMSPLTVRPTGTKDRHSKVRTAKGLRDRRVRLSAPTAIQFFDVQDRLGYDQPSKAVDWLIKKARAAIDELAPVEGVIMGDELTIMIDMPAQERKLNKDDHHSSIVKAKDEEQGIAASNGSDARAESRAKARERARERAKEKCITSGVPASTSVEAIATSADPQPVVQGSPSTNVHLLPEFFLLSSQLRQQFDDTHRPSDFSSMLTSPSSAPSAPQLLPFTSHFFPGLPSSSTSSPFVYPGQDDPSLHFSAPPIMYTPTPTTTTNNNNHHHRHHRNNSSTPISPRGTLQSIFSYPAHSSMQAHVPMSPLMMMGSLQTHAYGAMLSPVGGCDREVGHDDNGKFRQNSAELGSLDLHQHSRIPMRMYGMELDSHVEETRITASSMQADFQ